MTVQELINALEKVENKNTAVHKYHEEASEYSYVSEEYYDYLNPDVSAVEIVSIGTAEQLPRLRAERDRLYGGLKDIAITEIELEAKYDRLREALREAGDE